MRCTNQGYDYDEEDVQWTCTAEIPPEFKLGATDVICEGYRNADDKWVLKGSCGVEYRMLLTEAGERKFGKEDGDWYAGRTGVVSFIGTVLECLFLALFFGVMLWVFAVIVWAMLAPFFGSQGRRDAGAGQGLGRGDGGGGGGPPPPPYSPSPPPYNPYDSYKSAERQQRWTPGFWTGALGGGVAGYQMGRHADSGSRRDTSRGRSGGYDPGEGSSRSPRFSSTTSTTATTTSTGFGSTRRR